MLHRAHESAGMLLELPAGGGEGGPGLVADREGVAEVLLQRMNPRTHRGLGHMQPFRCAVEVSCSHDVSCSHGREEGPGKLCVQDFASAAFISVYPISTAIFYRLSNLLEMAT